MARGHGSKEPQRVSDAAMMGSAECGVWPDEPKSDADAAIASSNESDADAA
jgi:hypothetical protein